MNGFVVNRHGRIVLPDNFFPRLDFRVFATLEEFDATVTRDFDGKHPTDHELVKRALGGLYVSRYELLRDIVANVRWANRYALTMYDQRPTRWADAPRTRPDVYLPVVVPAKAIALASVVEAAYHRLPAMADAELEELVFTLLLAILRGRSGDGSGVAARNPTIAEALAVPGTETWRLPHYDPDFAGCREEDVIDFGHPSPELEALMRHALVLRSQFRWDPAAQQASEVRRLRGDDVVVLLYPRNEHVASLLSGDRARHRRLLPGAPPVAVQRPVTAPRPIEVRRHFAVMPRLEALAAYKGELVCSNTDLVRNAALSWSSMTAADIERKTGIVERRYSELSVDEMALRAAEAAIGKAGRAPHEMSAVIVCTSTSARTMPSTATWLSARLGIYQTHASYDLLAACAGLPYGIAAAVRLLQETNRPVLIVTVDKFSDKVGTVRSSRMLFGDGAAALVIGPTRGRPDVEVFQTYAGGPVDEVDSIVWPNPEFDHGMTVYGPRVMTMVRRYLAQMFDELRRLPDPEARRGSMVDAVDLIVPHQANQVMVASLAADVGLDPDRLYFNIAHVGNTSAASIPIALHDAVATGVIDRPRLVFAPGFGAGAVAGYVCLRIDPAVVAIEDARELVGVSGDDTRMTDAIAASGLR